MGKYIVYRDEWKRLYNHVLALDAISFPNFRVQFEEFKVRRELTKCYCGFKPESQEMQIEDDQMKLTAIATGNWGCGAFKGDKELKRWKLLFKSSLSFLILYFLF